MQWFGGVVTATGSHTVRPSRPSWSKALSNGQLWTVDSGIESTVTSAESGPLTGAVIGSHTVSTDDLRTWLWGDWRSGPPRWPGTYTAVVAHPEGMVVFTDPAHALPLYFCELEGSVVWSSSSRALSGLTDGGVDRSWLSELLADPAGPYGSQRSAFRWVRPVPAGHFLEACRGKRTRITRWWSPPKSAPRAEAVPLFRKSLEEAVAVPAAQVPPPLLRPERGAGLDHTVPSRRRAGLRDIPSHRLDGPSRDQGTRR